MTDIQRAMLGDHEAAERLTEKGVLLPCPFCKKPVSVWESHYGVINVVECMHCNIRFVIKWSAANNAHELADKWNTRAPILSAEEMERLEATVDEQ